MKNDFSLLFLPLLGGGMEIFMTIRELSKLINVSPAAISIVLNNKSGVSDETRERVLQAVNKYNYTPLKRAKAVKNKNVLVLKYYRSGVFVEENQGFIAGILDAVESSLQKEQLNMVLRIYKESFDKFLLETDSAQYEGLILIGTELTPESYNLFDRISVPYVVVDNVCPHTVCNSVCMDNEENVYIALEYLKKCGHKSIGYIGGNIYSENFQIRRKGFLESVKILDMDYIKEHTYRISPTMVGAYNDMLHQLTDISTLPDCFFADNDTLALGAMKALKEKGFKIPADVSVIGFDDIPFSAVSSPALTTVHVQRKQIGRVAVEQLLKIKKDKKYKPVKTLLTGKLIIRDSVAVRKDNNRQSAENIT